MITAKFLSGYSTDVFDCKFKLIDESKLHKITRACPTFGTSISREFFGLATKLFPDEVVSIQGTIHNGIPILYKNDILKFDLVVKKSGISFLELFYRLGDTEFFKEEFLSNMFSMEFIDRRTRLVKVTRYSLLGVGMSLLINLKTDYRDCSDNNEEPGSDFLSCKSCAH